MRRRTLVRGLLAGVSCLGWPRDAAACGAWRLHDVEEDFVVRHLQGSAGVEIVRTTEKRRYRVRRDLYRLLRRDGGIAVFKPTGKRLFEVVDDELRMYGESVGTLEGTSMVVEGVNYRFTIEDTDDELWARVRLYRDDVVVAQSDKALHVVCGFGVTLPRRLVYHAMWRELVWPEFRAHLIEAGDLPGDLPREGSTD